MIKNILLQKLNYHPETGTFTWKRTSRRGFEGKLAGHKQTNGYIAIRLDGKLYYAHRLIWLAETGNLPSKHIDHKNRNPSDNRFCNLKECSRKENMRNTKRHESRIGYCFDKTHGKWKVYLDRPDKKRINLGTVKTKQEAIELLSKHREPLPCNQESTHFLRPSSTRPLVS